MDQEKPDRPAGPIQSEDARDPFFGELPKQVVLTEVGPRDGFQFEKITVPTDKKAEIIRRLAAAGFKRIQVASFVHPGKVPQMADAEKLLAALPVRPEVAFSALVLNMTGVHRAVRAGVSHIEVSISASNRHSLNNTGMDAAEAMRTGLDMIALSKVHGMRVRASIQCAFGCAFGEMITEDHVAAMAQNLATAGADALCLADTTGMAAPVSIRKMLAAVQPVAADLPLELHLHDTRGLGLVNVLTALTCGVSHFDTAMAGMGGCPFIPGAAGNIATEDTLNLLSGLQIETGLNLPAIAECSRELEAFFGRRFPGKIYRLCDCPIGG